MNHWCTEFKILYRSPFKTQIFQLSGPSGTWIDSPKTSNKDGFFLETICNHSLSEPLSRAGTAAQLSKNHPLFHPPATTGHSNKIIKVKRRGCQEMFYLCLVINMPVIRLGALPCSSKHCYLKFSNFPGSASWISRSSKFFPSDLEPDPKAVGLV